MPLTSSSPLSQDLNRKRCKHSYRSGSPLLNNITILKTAEHIVGLFSILAGHSTDQEWLEMQKPILEYLNLADEDLDELMHLWRDLGIVDPGRVA